MRALVLFLFVIALLATGVLGTETRLLFFWPCGLLLGLAGVLMIAGGRARIRFSPSDACLASVLLFGMYVGIRAWKSPVESYAREDFFMMAAALVTYVLTATAASHPRWRTILVLALLLLGAGNLVVGFIHFTGHWNFYVVPYFARVAGEGRIGGFFVNPNHLAAFFSFAIFLTTSWFCFGRGVAAWRLLLAFMAISMTIGTALTISRGGLIGLACGSIVFAILALWLVWQTQRHLFWRLLIAGVVLSALGSAILYKVNEEYLKSRMDSSPMTTDIRLGIWEAALAQHAQSPVFGAGSRQFYEGSIQYRPASLPGYAREGLFAHNEYLQLLADYGWVGAGLLLLVVLTHFANGLRFLGWFVRVRFINTGRVQSQGLALALGCLAALVATLVHAVFEFHFHVPALVLTGALALGILANPGFEGQEPNAGKLPLIRPLLKVVTLLAALALLAGPWLYGRADYFAALAQIDQSEKQTAEQIAHLDQAIQLDDRNGETHYQRALARLESVVIRPGETENATLKAIQLDLEKAVQLNAYRHLYWLALADVYDAQGKHEEALKAVQTAIRLAPLHEEPRMALGMHWHRLGEFEKAEQAYLWASQSRAWNEEGTTRWIDNYRQLLRHVKQIRERTQATAPAR